MIKQRNLASLSFVSKCCISECALRKYECHEGERKRMKVNPTPPVEDAALIQTPSSRKLSLSFNCLGKRFSCLTDMVVMD